MLYFNSKDVNKYLRYIPELLEIQRVVEEIEAGNILEGSYDLSETLSVNIFSYQTSVSEHRNWEAHENHIDVHVVRRGTEIVEYVAADRYAKEAIDIVNDSYSFQGESTNQWVLKPQDYLVLLPNEGHKTGVTVEESTFVSKAVLIA